MEKTPEKKIKKNPRNLVKNDAKTDLNLENKQRDLRVKYKFMQDDVWQKLNQAISVGMYIQDACVFAGISDRQFRRWRELAQQGIEPYAHRWQEINKSEASGVLRHLLNIQTAGNNGSWQASAWLLERKYPDKFGKREHLKVSQDDNDYDVVLHWADGNEFIDADVSDMSGIKKEQESDNGT